MSIEEILQYAWDMEAVTNNGILRSIELGNSNIRVAIVDSGIDSEHPGFEKNLKKSISYIDSLPDKDFIGHGTMLAGQIAGNGVIKGITPKISLYSYKIFNSNWEGNVNNLIKALYQCIEDKVHIINLSMGFYLDKNKSQTTISEVEKIFSLLNQHSICVVSSNGYHKKDKIDKRIQHYPSSISTVFSCQSLNKKEEKVNSDIIAEFCMPAGNYLFGSNLKELIPVYVPIEMSKKFYKEMDYPLGYSFMAAESLAAAKLTGIIAFIQSYMLNKKGYILKNGELKELLEKYSKVIEGTKYPVLFEIIMSLKE